MELIVDVLKFVTKYYKDENINNLILFTYYDLCSENKFKC